jgi:hypothetical protein
MRPSVHKITAALAATEVHTPSSVFKVNLDQETLQIPYRVYYNRALLRWKLLSSYGVEKLVLACVGTRHYDGYLRQQCVRSLLRSDVNWVLPYIVQLAAEYVVEIVDDVATGIGSLDSSFIVEFVKQNPAYIATFGRRVTSYWNEYHRDSYPFRSDYPGSKVLAYLLHTLE